jgi:hypothetical protein
MANTVASLLVQIGADVTGIEKGGDRAIKKLDSLGEKTRELGNKMAMLGAAAAAAGAAMVAGLVKSGMATIDSQAKIARSLGATIDGLRGLQLAAGEAGVSGEALKKNMEQLNARLGEAQRGTGQAKKALDMLGLSALDLTKMDVDKRMAVIADRIRELGLSSSQTADVLKNFGIKGGEMVDMLRQGGDAIRAAREDVDALGLSISAVDAAKVEMANDAMERMKLTMEAISNRLAVAFAPILKALADRFNQLARENQGFGDVAIKVAEWIVMAFAKVADVVQGLRVAFKALQLIATGFWATLVTGAEGAVGVFASFADVINAPFNAMVRAMNHFGANMEELPSVHTLPFAQGLYQFAEEARNKVGDVRDELHELAMQEMPSDRIKRFVDEIKAAADEAAKVTVASMPGGGTYQSEDEGSKKEAERQQKELDAYRKSLEDKLQAIREFAMTEEEEEIYRHEERMARIVEGLEAEIITRQEYQELEATLEQQHVERLTEIRRKGMTALEKFQALSWQKQTQVVLGALTDMTAGVATESRKMFELNKAAGLANAIVNAYVGISKTLAEYPFPISAVMAAVQAAAAFAQINAIKSASFGGGGAAPSLAGGTPATPVSPVNSGQPQSSGGTLMVQGLDPSALYTGNMVRELAARLAEHQRDGGTVKFI